MLRFFRNIRRRLLESGKVRNYTLYALGEIVLVVIGILIALQINNWNTEQKRVATELEMLSEIQSALIADSIQLATIISREQSIVRLIDSILLEFGQRGYFSNDSLEVYLGKALLGERIDFVTTPYNVLISSGIDLIHDNDLRFAIAKYYDQTLPGVESDSEDLFQEWWECILPIIRDEAKEFTYGKRIVPYSMNAVFKIRS
ncbi:MAG: hypothetical protein IPJ74_23910 [Saprospiraceae bacterium]|nr:hypothetical protein [Saprospiraceae bacterium]